MTFRTNERGGAALFVVLAIAAAFVVFGVALYGYAVSIRNAALDRELQLVAQYKVNQTELSSYVSTFYEQVGVANLKSAKVDEVIRGALQGRFGDDGFQGGSLFAAFHEAYPDVQALNIYDQILPTIAAGREGFRNKQQKIIDEARAYDRWRKDGIFRAWVLSGIYPSSDLAIDVGGETLYAEAALKHLANPVLDSRTNKAYETHELEPLAPPR
ncbi:MAG TPA: hypothetical protein VD862_00640 [Candidatus Paceibacterota bacterium]|nr:hypothetical protein [Candidatus Paceibacterota bacterium]